MASKMLRTAAPEATITTIRFDVGDRVSADYRTSNCEPNAGQPWLAIDHRGTVIAMEDPRAWEGTYFWPSRRHKPRLAAIVEHVQWCLATGLLVNVVPVAWDFGNVYWEKTSNLDHDNTPGRAHYTKAYYAPAKAHCMIVDGKVVE
jgi:hypothetical protein